MATIATLFSSPVAAFIFGMEVLVAIVVLAPVGRLMKQTIVSLASHNHTHYDGRFVH